MQIDKTLTEEDFRKILKNTKKTLCKTKLIGAVAKKLKKRSARDVVYYFIEDISFEYTERYETFRSVYENSGFFDKNKNEILKIIEFDMKRHTNFKDTISYHQEYFRYTKKEIQKLELILSGEEDKDDDENYEDLMLIKYYLLHEALTILELEIGDQYYIYLRNKKYAEHKTN
jgi:hypothetical protein